MSELEVRNIIFGYSEQPLLYNLSLQIQAGEMVGLLGPNGSGKTTLMRLLSGVLRPQSGQVLLEGRDLQTWGQRRVAQRIAVVPQELHMPFAFTVEHMVSLGRTPFVKTFFGSHGEQDRRIAREALEAAGIVHLAERIFNELSGGERQRVLIAMALAQQPGVLLLDEPTSHLDIKYQIETLELAQRLNSERGMTIVAAMHDLNLAARYFPRLMLFQRGIVADAGPSEVLEPGLLGRVYGIEVQVGILRGAQHLSILPPNEDAGQQQADERSPLVHVMAGGGSGERVMRALADLKLPFVAGALHIGDSDHTLALRLATEVITEQPYAPISSATRQAIRESLARVALLLLCPFPIGPGNVSLLEEALAAARRGLPVFMLARSTVEGTTKDRPVSTTEDLPTFDATAAGDYTGGEGVRLIAQLISLGAQVVGSVGEMVEVLPLLHEKI